MSTSRSSILCTQFCHSLTFEDNKSALNNNTLFVRQTSKTSKIFSMICNHFLSYEKTSAMQTRLHKSTANYTLSYGSTHRHAAIPDAQLKIFEKYNNSSQGQRSRSTMPALIQITGTSKIYYHVKVRNCIRVWPEFSSYRQFSVKVKGQGQMSPKSITISRGTIWHIYWSSDINFW